MYDLAMEAYDKDGEIFPIHCTCLGWQATAVKFSGGNPEILGTAPLTFSFLCILHAEPENCFLSVLGGGWQARGLCGLPTYLCTAAHPCDPEDKCPR